eukprot:TRINITY_DN712_c0_g3_i1.p1 TRINITY_DN712_c0_g3~~TRINITY_DN712_c0_g3_i1.p1  ORF type:complete len:109 (-),score=25.58 TRINITY_DN712_c0_g3_i1:150-476(-)
MFYNRLKLVARKGTNLCDLIWPFKDFSIGKKVTRRIWWRYIDTYWTITRVVPKLINTETGHKRANIYGIYTWRGKTDNRETQIRSIKKKQWKFLDEEELKKFNQSKET